MNINAGILAALLTITLHYITFVQTNNGAEHDTITPPNTFLYYSLSRLSKLVGEDNIYNIYNYKTSASLLKISI